MSNNIQTTTGQNQRKEYVLDKLQLEEQIRTFDDKMLERLHI